MKSDNPKPPKPRRSDRLKSFNVTFRRQKPKVPQDYSSEQDNSDTGKPSVTLEEDPPTKYQGPYNKGQLPKPSRHKRKDCDLESYTELAVSDKGGKLPREGASNTPSTYPPAGRKQASKAGTEKRSFLQNTTSGVGSQQSDSDMDCGSEDSLSCDSSSSPKNTDDPSDATTITDVPPFEETAKRTRKRMAGAFQRKSEREAGLDSELVGSTLRLKRSDESVDESEITIPTLNGFDRRIRSTHYTHPHSKPGHRHTTKRGQKKDALEAVECTKSTVERDTASNYQSDSSREFEKCTRFIPGAQPFPKFECLFSPKRENMDATVGNSTTCHYQSDSSIEEWSIDDDSVGIPIKFEVENKRYVHPPLPPGWEIRVSKSRNRPYYTHPDFGTTWHCPVVLQAKPHKKISLREEIIRKTSRNNRKSTGSLFCKATKEIQATDDSRRDPDSTPAIEETMLQLMNKYKTVKAKGRSSDYTSGMIKQFARAKSSQGSKAESSMETSDTNREPESRDGEQRIPQTQELLILTPPNCQITDERSKRSQPTLLRSTRDSRLLPIDETNEKVEDEAESTPIYRRTPDTREGAICETTNDIASVESHLAPHNGASRGKQQVLNTIDNKGDKYGQPSLIHRGEEEEESEEDCNGTGNAENLSTPATGISKESASSGNFELVGSTAHGRCKNNARRLSLIASEKAYGYPSNDSDTKVDVLEDDCLSSQNGKDYLLSPERSCDTPEERIPNLTSIYDRPKKVRQQPSGLSKSASAVKGDVSSGVHRSSESSSSIDEQIYDDEWSPLRVPKSNNDDLDSRTREEEVLAHQEDQITLASKGAEEASRGTTDAGKGHLIPEVRGKGPTFSDEGEIKSDCGSFDSPERHEKDKSLRRETQREEGDSCASPRRLSDNFDKREPATLASPKSSFPCHENEISPDVIFGGSHNDDDDAGETAEPSFANRGSHQRDCLRPDCNITPSSTKSKGCTYGNSLLNCASPKGIEVENRIGRSNIDFDNVEDSEGQDIEIGSTSEDIEPVYSSPLAPRFRREMSWRVVNPPHPLCSLQKIESLFRRRRAKSRKKAERMVQRRKGKLLRKTGKRGAKKSRQVD